MDSQRGSLTHVVLTGFMASGKSAVGRAVARRLGWGFLDLDRLIEEAEGRSIADIFEQDGEPAFRDIEHATVRALSPEQSTVLATGGGTFTNERNQVLLKELGVVVCLVSSFETTMERVRRNTKRPLASAPDAEETLRELYARRLPEYRKADVLVETEGLSIDQAASRVISMIGPRLRQAAELFAKGQGA
jgi:shikimate kinase